MIHGKLTKEKIIADVDRLLNELRDGTGEYEGEGADGFPQLQEWKRGPERMLDWAQTKRNVDGWLVRIKTADSEYDSLAEELSPAAFPKGLVEILRGRVHGKVDEAFK